MTTIPNGDAGQPPRVRIVERYDGDRLVHASVSIGVPPTKREDRHLRVLVAEIAIAASLWFAAVSTADIDVLTSTDFAIATYAALGAIYTARIILDGLRRFTPIDRFFTREVTPNPRMDN